LEYSGQQWKDFWIYTDRNKARDLYQTRTYLKAEGLFQLEERNGVTYRLTAARVIHPGTGEKRKFALEKPQIFAEIAELGKMNQDFAVKEAEQREAAKLNEIGVASKTFRSPATGMEFVLVYGGCFQMGYTFGDGMPDQKPQHEVCLSHYYIGKYEVTQAQWMKIMGQNPSQFKHCGYECPVENVSWNDVEVFIRKLNEIEKTENYRFPTEAEWEYAATSGGKQERFSGTNFSEQNYAWVSRNSDDHTHPVGQKEPNGLGLHDMTGNVREWCADWYDENYYRNSPKNNPRGPGNGQERVVRGGSFRDDHIMYMSTAGRSKLDPRRQGPSTGFRLSFSPQ
jgi:formylglycine-generating enzyme required for sulfatase activity